MRYITPIFLASFFFLFGEVFAGDQIDYEGITFNQVKVPTYKFDKFTPQVAFRMEYAHAEVAEENIAKWARIQDRVIAYEIDLVFTLYPKDIKAWRTNYDQLLSARLKTLFEIDPQLKTYADKITWNMVLQTQCTNEPEAMNYFHGFVVKFRPKRMRVIDEVRSSKDLRALVRGTARTRDSTVIKILERNPQWENMLVVMDWTASMYRYGAQLVLWHKLNMRSHQRVRHFVFFNDGNKKKTDHKKVGKTGGVYRSKSTEIDEIVRTMEIVMHKGNGGDRPENDIEALMTGVQYLRGFDEVVLIADNKSDVRDLELITKIGYPVRVILCGVGHRPIHPHYIKLAFETGGSLHTLEKDFHHKLQLNHTPSASLNHQP